MNNRKTTRASITRTIEKLRLALAYDPREECTLLPDGSAFCICTNSALYLQRTLGGAVVGYHHSENPEAEIGAAESGHDFLVLEQFIVDIWAAETYGTNPVVRRSDARIVRKLYGDPVRWRLWRGGRFENFLRLEPSCKKK
jgi:hypothetical protein